MSMTGSVSVCMLEAPSGGLARLQPLRQQRVRIELEAGVEVHAAFREQLARAAVPPGLEEIHRAADVRPADEDLRNRARARPRREHGANLAAAVAGLIRDGVEVDARVLDTEPGEELAHRPAELAPLEREHHDGLVA